MEMKPLKRILNQIVVECAKKIKENSQTSYLGLAFNLHVWIPWNLKKIETEFGRRAGPGKLL